ncbi:hypothetical protein WNY78_08875 [Psychroserpens sp. AS72]|uniref:SecDF P1 head subdomain-containing protein n=1 Tax=Psychroserpens sp. AS72 TaxID=3135775 RepID=UPI00317AEE9E
MIKNLLVLVVVSLLFSCGNVTPKHKYTVIYEFENLDKITDNEKLGTVEVLNKRLDQFASNYDVILNNKQQIQINLSTNLELEAVNDIVTNSGKLEFWGCFKASDIGPFFTIMMDLIKAEDDTSIKSFETLSGPISGGVLSLASTDVELFEKTFQNKEILALLPPDMKRAKFIFGQPVDGRVDLYVVKTPPNGLAFVNETHITDARQTYTQTNRPSISMEMNKKGAERWERMTGIAYQQQSQIAMALNDIVYSVPTASSGVIKGGKTEISGNFTLQEAQDLALIFGSHKRIPKLKFVNSSAINDEQ